MKCQFLFYVAAALVLLLGAWVSYAPAALEDGLVGYYQFEGNDDGLKDSSGNENHGRNLSAERTNDGKFGKGLRFKTNQQGAMVPGSDSLLVKNDEFTVAFWAFPEKFDLAGENRAIYKHQQYNVDLLHGGGRMEIRVANAWKGTGVGNVMEVNEWHLIVATVFEETGTYYTDGVRQGQVQGIFKIDVNVSDIQIGFMSLNSYVGVMDELRIYNRGFDEDEVLELFELEPGEQSVKPRHSSMTTAWGAIKYLR
jgi:hypothetical protein